MARPHLIELWIELKLLSRITRSELSLATSHPDPIQSPTSANWRAWASAILSPVIPTNAPFYLTPDMSINLSSAVALAIIFSLP